MPIRDWVVVPKNWVANDTLADLASKKPAISPEPFVGERSLKPVIRLPNSQSELFSRHLRGVEVEMLKKFSLSKM